MIGSRRGGSHAQWSDDVEGMALSLSAALLTFLAIGPTLADHELIRGCDDGPKRAVCRKLLDLANGFGGVPSPKSRTETTFLPRANLGFDLTQRFLFGKPMVNRGFAAVRGLVA